MTEIQHALSNQIIEYLKHISKDRRNKHETICINRFFTNVRVYLSFENTELASSKKTVPSQGQRNVFESGGAEKERPKAFPNAVGV